MHPSPPTTGRPDVAELAADLSDQWLVEVGVGEDGDDACFGPLAAGMAWDLAVEINDKRPEWTVSVVPLYVAEPADYDHRPVRGGPQNARRIGAGGKSVSVAVPASSSNGPAKLEHGDGAGREPWRSACPPGFRSSCRRRGRA